MKRRDFLATACVGTVAAASLSTEVFAQERPMRQFIEIRKMVVSGPDKAKKLQDFAAEFLFPRLKEAGIGPFGMAEAVPELNGKDAAGPREVFLFLPYKSLRDAMMLRGKLGADADLAAGFMAYKTGFSSKNPGYNSMESTLLQLFKTEPNVIIPTLSADRILQLRYYRSFDEDRNAAKISMFEEGGEIALFKASGMNHVFFGEAIFGDYLPNMTYMLSFANNEAKDLAWKTFVESDGWNKLKADPKYADTATDILNFNLRPFEGSEI